MQSNSGHKRAVLYARVSTDEQADKGYSLPSQFDAMRKYAAQQGFEIVAEFQDDYSGATPIEMRPEGSKAYLMLKSDGADVIIAYTIDRFVRPPEDGDEWELPILIRGLAKLGKEIHTVRRGKLNTGFADLLIALLDARKAGEERRDIRERTMRGKMRKLQEGKAGAGGGVPYGYRCVYDEHGKIIMLEIDETTARIVRLIYQWYIHGDEHSKRLSMVAIAVRLSEMHTPTPGEIQPGCVRKRAPSMWSHSAVGRILTSEVYAGVWWYGGRIGDVRNQRPKEEQIAVNVPAIVSRETWEQAQRQLGRNKTFARRNAKRDYLLHGLIHCGLCGKMYSGIFSRSFRPGVNDRGRAYYRDNLFKMRHAHLEGRCPNKHIRAEAIEADIWDEIRELFQDLDKLWNELKAAQRSADEQLQSLRDKLEITDDFIRHEETEAAKIAAALPDTEKGSTARKLMLEKDKAISARLADLSRQREKIIKQIGEGRITDECIETIMDFARKVRRGISKAENNFQAKRRMIEALKVDVTVTPGKYHLKTIICEKDGEISRIAYGGVRIVSRASRLRRGT
ncbi:MAG: hypothetical protein FJ009_18490 [Chloroflexi bacterium]|nr:hypothetical protein [Chloroflexota bacterium]